MGRESGEPPAISQNRCSHEPEIEILLDIRDTFERLRNVKVAYIMITWLP